MRRFLLLVKKSAALLLTLIFIATIFSVIPVVEAASLTWSEGFVRNLTKEHPLSAGQLYVGYGKQNITPLALDDTERAAAAQVLGIKASDLPLGYTGVPMGGYGHEENRIAIVNNQNENVQQDIFTICVAVMDGNGNIVLFDVNDLLNSGRYSTIRKKVSEVTGIPENHIMISATHSHSTPANSSNARVKATSQKYHKYQDEQIAQACVDAINDLYPADIYIDSVDVVREDGSNLLSFVRNYETQGYNYSGTRISSGDNHGSYSWNSSTKKWVSTSRYDHNTNADAQLQLIKFKRADNQNVLMCNYQAHPHRTGKNNSSVISADVVGSFRDAIESDTTLGANYRVAYINGAGGNTSFSTSFTSTQNGNTKQTEGYISSEDYNFNVKTTLTFKDGNGRSIVVPKNYSLNTQGELSAKTLNGVSLTVEEVRRLASYFIGEKLAEFAKNEIKNSGAFKKVNGGTVKAREITYSNIYHPRSEEITTASASYLQLIWNATNYGLKQIVLGYYNFTDSMIDNFGYINETPSTSEINKIKTNSDRKDSLTDEQAYNIAKFTTRIQGVINSTSSLYTPGGSSSFFSKTTFQSTRFNSIDNFASTIPQYARNGLIAVAGTLVQSKDGAEEVINSPYHANAIAGSRVTNEGKTYKATLTTFSIGDIAFGNFPGELFDTNGMFLKDNTAVKMTFVMGYTNGSIGYIPSIYAHLYGSYETDTTPTTPGDAETMAGIHSDTICDLVFDGEVYNLSVGDFKSITKADGTPLYSYTDNFNYNLYKTKGYGTEIGGNSIDSFSYNNKSVIWKSSDTKVATVDQNGRIRAVGQGVAVITAVHTSGNNATGKYNSNFVGSASCTVVVGNSHEHCVECGLISCTNQNHAKYEFKKTTSSTTLPTSTGYYYLNTNLNLTSQVKIQGDVVLCLNGKTITARNKGAIQVSSGGSLTICDCSNGEICINSNYSTLNDNTGIINVKDGGKFRITSGCINASGTTSNRGNAIYISSGGKVTVDGGIIIGGTATDRGGAILNYGELTINGGTLECGSAESYGGGIYSAGEFTMTGGSLNGGSAGLMGGCLHLYGEKNYILGGNICGGEADRGGCICIDSETNIVFDGATISGGSARLGGNIYFCSRSNGEFKSGTVMCGIAKVEDLTVFSQGGNIYINKNTNFVMTGGTVSGGTAYGSGGNVYVLGVFDLSGGTITAGTSIAYLKNGVSDAGYGGNMQVDGTLNMSGGVISEGIANDHGGGNISVHTTGAKVNMTGGIIKDGIAKATGKGNVYIWYKADECCFDMSGGTITDDSTFCIRAGFSGGGIFCANSSSATSNMQVRVSGNAVVNGNILSQTYDEIKGKNINTYSNIYLESGKVLSVGNCDGSAKMGISRSVSNLTSEFSVGGSSSRFAFFSDIDGYYVVKSGDNLALSQTQDTTADPIQNREGTPSDIALENNYIVKDDFDHYNLAVNDTLDLSAKYSNITSVVKTSSGTKVTLTQNTVKGVSVGCETFLVSCSGGTAKVAVAVGHYHCLECGTFGCQVNGHTNINFNIATGTTAVTATGNYYLTSDCNVTSAVTISSGKTVNLCLNGHTSVITENAKKAFIVSGTLNITDCSAHENDNGTGVIKAYSSATSGGGVISVSGTFSLYRGTIDASNVTATEICNGTAIYVKGKMYINGGKIIGGTPVNTSGAMYVDSTSNVVMNGGVIDCYNVLSTYSSVMDIKSNATFTLNNGRIIGGRQYSGGAIRICSSGSNIGTFTINDGIVQDGSGYTKITYNSDGTVSGTISAGGNFSFSGTGSILNINGGIIANGTSYGMGGNVNCSSGNYVYMTGGTMTGGRSLKSVESTASTSVAGANIVANGTFEMSGGVITDGFCEGCYGANICVYSKGSNVKISGGVIKNGLSTSSVGSNVAVWWQAGSVTNDKIAFEMTGGLITDDEDLVVPYGYYAGGLGVIRNSEGNYYNSTKISGTAQIKDNIGTDINVSDVDECVIILGELTEGADLRLSMSLETTVAKNVDAQSVKYIKLNDNATNHILVYDPASMSLSVAYVDRTNADRFINCYLKDTQGDYITEINDDNYFIIKENGALDAWYNETEDSRNIINSVYKGKCGINDVEALLLAAENHTNVEAYEWFIDEYLKTSENTYITAVNLSNYRTVLECETAYNALSEEQKAKADNAVGVSISGLINTAKTVEADYQAALTFTGSFKSGGMYYSTVTLGNCDDIAAFKDSWQNLNINAKTYANNIVSGDIAAIIDNAVAMSADKQTATNFISENLKINNTIITAVDETNCEAVASARAEYDQLSGNVKAIVNTLTAMNVDALISTAETMCDDIAVSNAFISDHLYMNGYLITAITEDNFIQFVEEVRQDALSAWNSMSEYAKQRTDTVYASLGGSCTVEQLFTDSTDIYNLFAVNVYFDTSTRTYVFYAAIDSSADTYKTYGFEIDFGAYKSNVMVNKTCTGEDLSNLPISDANDLTALANDVYSCEFYLYKRDYGKTVTVRAFTVNESGEKVYSREVTVVLADLR